MVQSLPGNSLTDYVKKQLLNFYPDGHELLIDENSIKQTLKRVEHCFSHVCLKHYFNGRETIFNHLFSDHYVMFVWFLSNEIFRMHGKNSTSNKLYYLNKSLNGIDCMYDTNMPDIFLIFHGVGTMLGKADYSDFFVALHGCTIGSHRGKYPVLGKGVSLTANSSIIGNCNIGNRVSVSSFTSLFEKNILPDHVVFKENETGTIKTKPSENCYAQNFFNVDLRSL
jgi:serine O-acetyltransferase